MNIQFADVASSDGPALADLRVEAMRESLERLGRFDPVRARERLLSAFDAKATRHVMVDGVRVGFFVVRVQSGEMLLDHLYIHPQCQGVGVGSFTLTKVLAEAQSAGLDVRVVALKESDSNRFYRRHGFELVRSDEWDHHYICRHRQN